MELQLLFLIIIVVNIGFFFFFSSCCITVVFNAPVHHSTVLKNKITGLELPQPPSILLLGNTAAEEKMEGEEAEWGSSLQQTHNIEDKSKCRNSEFKVGGR